MKPVAPVVAALLGAFPRVEPANRNDRYDHRLNGFPVGAPWRVVYPLPVLDPETGRDRAWRRLRLQVVR